MADPAELTDNVSLFPGVTPLDFEPNIILDVAKRAGLASVVIIGYDKDGAEFFSSSVGGGPQILWLLERTKINLLRVCDDE